MTLSLVSALSNVDNTDPSLGDLTSTLNLPRPCQTLNPVSPLPKYNHWNVPYAS